MQSDLSEQFACVALCIAAEKAGRFGDPGIFLRERKSTEVRDLPSLHTEYEAWCGSNGYAALRFERFEYALTVLANTHQKVVRERLRSAQSAKASQEDEPTIAGDQVSQ